MMVRTSTYEFGGSTVHKMWVFWVTDSEMLSVYRRFTKSVGRGGGGQAGKVSGAKPLK